VHAGSVGNAHRHADFIFVQEDDGFHVFGEIFIEAMAFLSAGEFIMV